MNGVSMEVAGTNHDKRWKFEVGDFAIDRLWRDKRMVNLMIYITKVYALKRKYAIHFNVKVFIVKKGKYILK